MAAYVKYKPSAEAIRERDAVLLQIRTAMNEMGFRPEDIAKELGMPCGTFENKIYGRNDFTLTQVAQIADFLHIEIIL